MENRILLGYEVGTGNEVTMSIHHTIITGMTQLSGKTTTLEAIISRANRRAIAFKTKRGESGFSNYREILPFFVERADWQYVSSLLEAVMREKMRFERPWIMKATKGTKSLSEVLANVQSLRAEATKELPENIYTALEEYLKIVVPQIEKLQFVKVLDLVEGINVMDLTEMSVELQGLVIQSTMEHVINNLHDTIIIVPEAWEHLPQGRNTPVKLYAETFIRKGAAVGNYLFIDTQDIAGIDKTPLRQCNNWILGRQREGHEVDRVREQIGKAKIDAEEIRSLSLGYFIAILGDEVRKAYVLPAGVPQEMGRRVALGEITSADVGKYMSERKDAEGRQPPAQIGTNKSPALMTDGASRKVEGLEAKLAQQNDEIQVLKSEIEGLQQELTAGAARIGQITKALETAVQKTQIADQSQLPSSLTVDDLNQLVDQRMRQIIQFDKPTVFTSVDVSGRLREVIKERFIREIGARIRTLPLRAVQAAMVLHERKTLKRGELYAFLRGGGGRISDDFYQDLQLLEETRLAVINKETGVIRWALGEYLKRELGEMYDEATIRSAEDYLSSLLLPSS